MRLAIRKRKKEKNHISNRLNSYLQKKKKIHFIPTSNFIFPISLFLCSSRDDIIPRFIQRCRRPKQTPITYVPVLARPYLNANKREALADYALPVAVIVLSFIGSYIFRDVDRECF